MSNKHWLKKYGPWALVTGASSGIGEEFACQLAKRGLHIVLVGRDEERLLRVSKKCQDFGVETHIIQKDLANLEGIVKIKTLTGNRTVGLIVNNAGFGLHGLFVQIPLKEQLEMIVVHCMATTAIAHQFLPQLIEAKRGGLIMMASMAGFQGLPHAATYSATKAFDLIFGEGLAEEIKGSGVDLLTVAPGVVETPFFSHAEISLNHMAPALSSEYVVKAALDSLGKKTVFVPGLINKALLFFERLLPRQWVVKIAKLYLLKIWKNKSPK